MKFLFVSKESLSGEIGYRLVREGHQVRAYIEDPGDRDVFNGFIKKVSAWEKHVAWADVIVFDDVGFGSHAQRLRRIGKLVVGGSLYTDRLEIDRQFGQDELRRHKVPVLPSWEFSSYRKAIAFIREHPDRYVFKPCGNTSSSNKDLVILGESKTGDDLLEFLQQNVRQLHGRIPRFIIQKFISGIEIAVGAFFNGKDFIYPINVNFEHKRFFPGDIGPMTGEMGTLMYWSPPTRLFQLTLARMLPSLRKSGFVGYIDINCIVNGEGIYPLEFTSRFGYPTIQIQLEGITMPTGEWLVALARGEQFRLKAKKGFQIGVVLLSPLYLYGKEDRVGIKTYHDLAITFTGQNQELMDHIHLGDVKKERGVWRIAGNSGWLLVATGSGVTVEDARKKAYEVVRHVHTPNMFYRTDIGTRWVNDSDRLHTWDYL